MCQIPILLVSPIGLMGEGGRTPAPSPHPQAFLYLGRVAQQKVLGWNSGRLVPHLPSTPWRFLCTQRPQQGPVALLSLALFGCQGHKKRKMSMCFCCPETAPRGCDAAAFHPQPPSPVLQQGDLRRLEAEMEEEATYVFYACSWGLMN